jgi:hypothetical protein
MIMTDETTPAEDFAAFMDAALNKGTRITADNAEEESAPRDRRTWRDIDADERDPATAFAEFLNRRLNGGPDPDDIGDPESPAYDREKAIAEAIERHELDRYAKEAVELLRGVREGANINNAAARIAELFENAPRTPKPDPSQGRASDWFTSQKHTRGLEGFRDALRDAVIRSDGEGAWREIY